MKLSIAWIFDHIKANWKEIDIPELMARFSATTAEIEDVKHLSIDLDALTIGRSISTSSKGITVEIPEFKKKAILPERSGIVIDSLYLLKKIGKDYSWAILGDLGSEKEGLVPAVWCNLELIKGGWKKSFEAEDYIITLDNKAITNRPDMWGHRGFAREIAALLNVPLEPEENFLVSKPIKHYPQSAPVSSTNPFTIEIAADTPECGQPCKRLAGMYLPKVEYRDSIIYMAHRLARVDARPLNALVDTTNYVMFDIGQPMHAFDEQKISTHKLVARCAQAGETLELLDGDEIKLLPSDYVITDGIRPLALAGIMGGRASAVTEHTHSLFLESGNFDATTIRKTSVRIKKRTEASARFEKSLDPNNNTQALLRYLKLLDQYGISYQSADAVASVGPLAQEKVISVSHQLIVDRLGMTVAPERVEEILSRLGFGVQSFYNDQQVTYTITVSTARATKDITMPEDFVEEIARFIGYEHIPLVMPERSMAPFDIEPIERLKFIKNHMAFGLSMHEIQTYAFYDEEFLKRIDYGPEATLRIANPLSEHWQRLVSSLIPNALKTVYINSHKQDTLRFFECNRVWFNEGQPVEENELAGIFYEHKKPVDFYAGKAWLQSLFTALHIDVEWCKPSKTLDPWYTGYQAAELKYKGRIIGQAGKINRNMLSKIAEGDAFIFELDAGFLLHYKPEIVTFKQLSKYPEVHLDISVLVPYSVTVAQLQQAVKGAHPLIKDTQLLDFYEKPEWNLQKSITLSFTLSDETKTLTKDEIDAVWNHVVKSVEKLGATIR